MTIYGEVVLVYLVDLINKLVTKSRENDNSYTNKLLSYATSYGRNPSVSTGKQDLGKKLVDKLNAIRLNARTFPDGSAEIPKSDEELLLWIEKELPQFKQNVTNVSSTGGYTDFTYGPKVEKTLELIPKFYNELNELGLLNLDYSPHDAYSVLLYYSAKYCFDKLKEKQEPGMLQVLADSPHFGGGSITDEKKGLLRDTIADCTEAIRGCDSAAPKYITTRTRRITDHLHLLLFGNRELIRDNQQGIGFAPIQMSIFGGVGVKGKFGPTEGDLKDRMEECLKAITAIKNPEIVIEPVKMDCIPSINIEEKMNPLLEKRSLKGTIQNVPFDRVSGVDIKKTEEATPSPAGGRNRIFTPSEAIPIETVTQPVLSSSDL